MKKKLILAARISILGLIVLGVVYMGMYTVLGAEKALDMFKHLILWSIFIGLCFIIIQDIGKWHENKKSGRENKTFTAFGIKRPITWFFLLSLFFGVPISVVSSLLGLKFEDNISMPFNIDNCCLVAGYAQICEPDYGESLSRECGRMIDRDYRKTQSAWSKKVKLKSCMYKIEDGISSARSEGGCARYQNMKKRLKKSHN